MAINERLYVSGLIDKFDKAAEEKNIDEVIHILNEVGISDVENISAILKSLELKD